MKPVQVPPLPVGIRAALALKPPWVQGRLFWPPAECLWELLLGQSTYNPPVTGPLSNPGVVLPSERAHGVVGWMWDPPACKLGCSRQRTAAPVAVGSCSDFCREAARTLNMAPRGASTTHVPPGEPYGSPGSLRRAQPLLHVLH